MRSNLIDGKIPTPRSVVSAERRLQQLRYEAKRISEQIDDPGRILRYEKARDYDEWVSRARSALKYMDEEARQLDEWLSEQPQLQRISREDEERQIQAFWESP